jgi:tripartite-type tricarboxylate transporter receptor subunit TctC
VQFPASGTRRQWLAVCAAALAASRLPAVYAQEVIKILVGFPPGGAIDSTARIYADAARELGPMVVENKPGAAGNIAAGALAQSRPDGNTLMLAPVNVYSISQALYRNLAFDTSRDFAPVGIVAKFPWCIAVHPDIPVKSLAELVAWAKANPAKAICGMAATGSEGHLMAYAFGKAARIDLSFAAYRGGAPMAADLMAGHISMAFDPIVNLAQPHKAGKVRMLAITSDQRAPLLPEIPTFAESGYPAATGETWIGAAVKQGTSAARIQALAAAFSAAGRSAEVQEKLGKLGLAVVTGSAAEMAQTIAADRERYSTLVKALGLHLE